jgi:hypothetical protein
MIHLYTKYHLNPSNHQWENEHCHTCISFLSPRPITSPIIIGQHPCSIDWLIDYLRFTSRPRIFHLCWDVTIAGEGLQNLGLCSALRAFEQGGIFIVPHLLWHRTSVFFCLIRRTTPFSRLLRNMRGCRGGSQSIDFNSMLTCVSSTGAMFPRKDLRDLLLHFCIIEGCALILLQDTFVTFGRLIIYGFMSRSRIFGRVAQSVSGL